jgi:hypothetical protein
VVAPDLQRSPEQLAEAEPRVGAPQRKHRRRLADRHVVEDAERADHHARQQQSLERQVGLAEL